MGAILAVCIAGGYLYYRKRSQIRTLDTSPKESIAVTQTIDELLVPVYALVESEDKQFYSALRLAIWEFFGQRFNLSGSQLTKDGLLSGLRERSIDGQLSQKIQDILQKCEEGMFTNASLAANKKELLDQARQSLGKIAQRLF
jgi:hypothetical protein